MRRLFIFIFLLTASCANFNPETDSDLGSIKLNIDARSFLTAVVDPNNDQPYFSDGRIPESHSGVAMFRLSVCCYEEDTGNLVDRLVSYHEDFSRDIAVEIPYLSKKDGFRVLILADFVGIDDYGDPYYIYEHVNYKNYNTYSYTSVDYFYEFNAIGEYLAVMKPSKDVYDVRIVGKGIFCLVLFTNGANTKSVHLDLDTKLRNSPSGNPELETKGQYVQDWELGSSKGKYNVFYIIPVDGWSVLNYSIDHGDGQNPEEHSYPIDLSQYTGMMSIAVDCETEEIIDVGQW